MRRVPFVWQVHVRRELVEDEITTLRDMPYSMWREVMGRPIRKVILGRDGKTYRMLVTATWNKPESEQIRVTARLLSPLLRRTLEKGSFVITPDNQFIS